MGPAAALLIPAAFELGGAALDYKQNEEERKLRLKQLGLTEEQIKLAEKQRGFQRLMDIVGSGNKLTNQAMGARRLTNLRNSGQ